jgi:hypothetical protein
MREIMIKRDQEREGVRRRQEESMYKKQRNTMRTNRHRFRTTQKK